MIAQGGAGSLIHIGSQMGHVGAPNRSLYCASKWALEGMNKAIALDLAPHRIRSNTIAPTFIETPLTKPFLQDTAFPDSVLAKITPARSDEHTSDLQSLMRISYAVFSLNKKKYNSTKTNRK